MASLDIVVDGSEPRLQYDSLAAVVTGQQWDMLNSGSVFVDYITNTGFLIPLPFTSAWQTGGDGDYARVRMSEYDVDTPAKWVEYVGPRNSKDYYMYSLNVNEIVTTVKAYEKNQPFFLSWYSFNSGNEDHVELECGWVQSGVSVSLRVWSSGKVEIWKDTEFLTSGNIVDDKTYYIQPNGSEVSTKSGKGRALAGQRIDLALIPCRGRELLVMSNQGGGFNYRFEDLDPNEEEPTITEAGPFWWYVPEGQAQVQLGQMKFASTGWLISHKQKLRYAPFTGGSADVTVYAGTVTGCTTPGAVYDEDGGGAFTADGTADTVRVRGDLNGTGSRTPWVYGAAAEWDGQTADTSASDTSLLAYTLASPQPRYTVPESPTDVRFEVTLKSPVAAPADRIYRLGNRPFSAYIGDVAIFTGRTDNPHWSEGGAANDQARQAVLECRDYWKVLERYLFNDPVPLDGMNLGSAFGKILNLAGFDSSYQDFDTIDFDLPSTPAASQGEFALWPQAGDTAADWITRLHEDYAANYYIGWKPTATGPKFMLRGTASLGVAASAYLYDNIDDSLPAGTVYRRYRETTLEPEANDIWVMGQDPRTKLPIVAHYADLDSQDPTTVPVSRPSNWLGEIRRYGLTDPAITDSTTATWCVGVLRDRLTNSRWVAEWGCELLIKTDGAPVWRGDVVTLQNVGDFRVISFSGEHVLENAAAQFTEYNYQGEFIP